MNEMLRVVSYLQVFPESSDGSLSTKPSQLCSCEHITCFRPGLHITTA